MSWDRRQVDVEWVRWKGPRKDGHVGGSCYEDPFQVWKFSGSKRRTNEETDRRRTKERQEEK